MKFPVELLTTPAQCDEALADLRAEQEDLVLRQANYDHRDDKATTRATDLSAELATLDKDIATLNRELADMAADSKFRPRREAELRAAVKRRGDLSAAQQTTRNPVNAFRLAVDARQVAVQVPELQQAIEEVIERRDVLTAALNA